MLHGLKSSHLTIKWEAHDTKSHEKIIVIHAGSGRQIEECIAYCNRTGSILMELSTGDNVSKYKIECPTIICPNTAIPVLKMMSILKENGKTFSDYDTKIIESHQKNKTTVAGTAVELSKALHMDEKKIESVRDVEAQLELGIPQEHLNLHAYHKICIKDQGCEITIQLRVLGHDAYVRGVVQLLEILSVTALENKAYDVIDLV